MNEKDKKPWHLDKIRVVYPFDDPSCNTCLCHECGSSIKRKFILSLIPIKKEKGCINFNCKNFFYFKK
tara:strand:- start:741 stop:944 length:204 start_codon:yes stop_codon:yes gene_type:complete